MKISIVGGGASGLFLAAMLDRGHDIKIYDQGKRLGRKLLVAGKGGFNLTNSEDGDLLRSRYRPAQFMGPYLNAFGSKDFRRWLASLGIETFVGSSGRVFPVQGVKPIDVLNAILARMEVNGVEICTHHRWVHQKGNMITFIHHGEEVLQESDVVVYAIGGASWKKTGSDGSWLLPFEEMGVETVPFRASNCGWELLQHDPPDDVVWQPLKNIACATTSHYHRGELMLTDYGLEGSPLYAAMQEVDLSQQPLGLWLDLKPDLQQAQIAKLLATRTRKSITAVLKQQLKLTAPMRYLLKSYTDKATFQQPELLAKAIKHLSLPLIGPRPIDEAISTTGGVALSAITPDLLLKTRTNTYIIGEMLDWDAPTGGYLLQACASMAYHVAKQLNR